MSLPCSTVLWHTLDDNLIGVSVGSRIFSAAGCPYLLDAKSPDAGAVFCVSLAISQSGRI